MDSRSFLIEMSTDETLLYRINVKHVTLVSIFHLDIHVRRWMESSTFPITVIEDTAERRTEEVSTLTRVVVGN